MESLLKIYTEAFIFQPSLFMVVSCLYSTDTLFSDETFPEVQFNFGPNLQFLPDYAKPMSKRAEELIPEIVVNEMLDFLEATNNNNL